MRYAEYVQKMEYLPMTMEEIEQALKSRPIKRWAYLVHDKDTLEDGTLKDPHLHIEMELQSDQTPENIAKWFNDKPERIEKGKSKNPKYMYENMCSYLIHETPTADGKYHYDPADVTANFDFVAFIEQIRAGVKAAEERKHKHPLAEVLQMICDNKIPRLKIGDYVSDLDQIRYNRDIKTAYDIRDKKLARKEDRAMEVLYIEGQAGTGKTTLAKMFGRNKHYDVFVSGSSNDPFEGYQGQECVILDDIRGSDWKINDLLKVLDNHTSSLVKSRYSNKLLVDCKLMILTSVQSIEDLYKGLKENDNEPIEQLKRRCAQYIYLTLDTVEMREYDEKTRSYKVKGKTMNPITAINFLRNNASILDDFGNMIAAIKLESRDVNGQGEQMSLLDNKDLPF